MKAFFRNEKAGKIVPRKGDTITYNSSTGKVLLIRNERVHSLMLENGRELQWRIGLENLDTFPHFFSAFLSAIMGKDVNFCRNLNILSAVIN